jgi:hypothetical protein
VTRHLAALPNQGERISLGAVSLDLRVARGISKSHVQLAEQLAYSFMVMANTVGIVRLLGGRETKTGN